MAGLRRMGWLRVLVAGLGLLASLSAGGTDIRATPHNLTLKGGAVDTAEVCVFCHTPQHSATDGRSGMPDHPQWQPAIPLDHAYVIYDDIGRAQYGEKPTVGSQSIACLSCHDANQALSTQTAETDHPFGIPYRGFTRGRERLPLEEAAMDEAPHRRAKHLKSLDDFIIPSRGVVGDRSVWWVSAGGLSAWRTRADLPLYARPGIGGEVPYVECSSCHDPHIPTRLFLRVSNEGSRLCLTCHDK